MAPNRRLTPGYKVVYPNQEKAASHLVKWIVVVLLLVSVALMLIVTIGGWSTLQGLKAVNIIWCLLYVVMAIYVARWSRGVLPMAAAMGILLLILAVIAGTGLAGTSWFDRNHVGFAAPQTPFGAKGLSADVVGFFTILLAPVQLALIVFCMVGFSQGWNVETEVPEDESKQRGGRRSSPPPEPAPA